MTVEEVVDFLVRIYVDHPGGVDRRDPAAMQLREIGTGLDRAGGIELMRTVHQKFTGRDFRNARNLEMRWNGIGDWLG